MKKALRILSTAFLLVFMGFMVTACVPSNIEKAEAKMEDAGYTVVAYDGADDAEGCVGGIMATNVEGLTNVDTLIALLFESKDDAKDFAEKWDNDKYETATVKGKWVYAGTEDAIDVFTK